MKMLKSLIFKLDVLRTMIGTLDISI